MVATTGVQVYVPPFQRRFPNAQVYVSPECGHSLLAVTLSTEA